MQWLSFMVLALAAVANTGAFSDNNIEQLLTDAAINTLEPYKEQLRRGFWSTFDVTFTNPYNVEGISPYADYLTCELCTPGYPIIKLLLALNVTDELVVNVATQVCLALDLAPSPDACEPTVRAYAEPLLYIVRHKPDLTMQDFCGIINPGCHDVSADLRSWSITINGTTAPAKPRPNIPSPTSPLTKIVQFTDVHLDLDYVEGSSANCPLPTCCRPENGEPNSIQNIAGKFGHFSCELPEAGLKAMYRDAADKHGDAAFVFLTGDYIHSLIWKYGVDENTRHHGNVTQWLADAFASTDAEIYPLVGNHEPDIVNMFAPEDAWEDFPIRWMYEVVAKPFVQFIPEDQLQQFYKYGYYSAVSQKHPSIRIVALNTNLCYIQNFWLPYEPKDTYGQLQWFARTMQQAEDEGQKVYLLGHIHSGSGSCWSVWANQFNRVINRYSHLIMGQWYGHSHEQDYHVFFEQGTETPISVSFSAGSGVTDGMHSAYNVYYVDGERGSDSTWEIINQETIILNLTASNSDPNGEPVFQTILNAHEDFQLPSLLPSDVNDFVFRMICDNDLFRKYQEVVVKGHDSPRLRRCPNWDRECRASVLSGLFMTNSADRTHQERLRQATLYTYCDIQQTPSTSLSPGTDTTPTTVTTPLTDTTTHTTVTTPGTVTTPATETSTSSSTSLRFYSSILCLSAILILLAK